MSDATPMTPAEASRLLDYGAHISWCADKGSGNPASCDCGFAELYAEANVILFPAPADAEATTEEATR